MGGPHLGFAPVSGPSAPGDADGPGSGSEPASGPARVPVEYDAARQAMVMPRIGGAGARLRRALDRPSSAASRQTSRSALLSTRPPCQVPTTPPNRDEWGDGPPHYEIAPWRPRSARARTPGRGLPAHRRPHGPDSAWQQLARREAVGQRRPLIEFELAWMCFRSSLPPADITWLDAVAASSCELSQSMSAVRARHGRTVTTARASIPSWCALAGAGAGRLESAARRQTALSRFGDIPGWWLRSPSRNGTRWQPWRRAHIER